jgi:hypothetical protein
VPLSIATILSYPRPVQADVRAQIAARKAQLVQDGLTTARSRRLVELTMLVIRLRVFKGRGVSHHDDSVRMINLGSYHDHAGKIQSCVRCAVDKTNSTRK